MAFTKRNRLLALVCVCCMANLQAVPGSRFALVIGNGNYESMPKLANPVNDANDLSEVLNRYGFSVTTVADATLGQMNNAINTFIDKLDDTTVEAALFYYAGHGVQYNGTNYLVPVNAIIRNSYELMDKAVSMDAVINGIEIQGKAAFNLMILDACRDDPFSTTRSGGRGLSVIGTGGNGSMVVFATNPGNVALDGKDQNSPFSKALITAMQQPGKEIREIITTVKRSVQEDTNGLQIPWSTDSFTGEFYFQTIEASLLDSESSLQTLQQELALLESEISQRETAIKLSQNTDEARRLGAEQLRAKALEAAKQLELQRVAELKRQSEAILASMAAQESMQQEMDTKVANQMESLSQLVERKRAEIEQLQLKQLETRSIMEMFQAITQLNSAVEEIQTRYTQGLERTLAELAQLYQLRKEQFRIDNPRDPWETQAEHTQRITKTLTSMDQHYATERTALLNSMNAKRDSETAPIRDQVSQAKMDLDGSRFSINPTAVKVYVSPFDAEKKLFPISVVVSDALGNFVFQLQYSIVSKDRQVLQNEYFRILNAVQSKALMGRVELRVLQVEDNCWTVVPESCNVVDLTGSGESIIAQYLSPRYFVIDQPVMYKTTTSVQKMATPVVLPNNLIITGLPPRASININGLAGTANSSGTFSANIASLQNTQTTVTVSGTTLKNSVSIQILAIGSSKQLVWWNFKE